MACDINTINNLVALFLYLSAMHPNLYKPQNLPLHSQRMPYAIQFNYDKMSPQPKHHSIHHNNINKTISYQRVLNPELESFPSSTIKTNSQH